MVETSAKTPPDKQMSERSDNLSADELMREQRLQRNLKILIGALSLMIVGGLAAIIIRIVTMPPAASIAPQSTTAVSVAGGQIAVELPAGSRIVSMSISGNHLAIHHDGSAGAGIAIVDLDTGRRVVDVKPVEAVPRN